MNFTEKDVKAAIERGKNVHDFIQKSAKIWVIAISIYVVASIILMISGFGGIKFVLISAAVDLLLLYFLPFLISASTLLNKNVRMQSTVREFYDSWRYSRKYRNHQFIGIEAMDSFGKRDWVRYIDSLLAGEKNRYNRCTLLGAKRAYLDISCRFDEAESVFQEIEATAPGHLRNRILFKKMSHYCSCGRDADFISLYEKNQREIGKLYDGNLSEVNLGLVFSSLYEMKKGNFEKATELRQMSIEVSYEDKKISSWLKKYPNYVLIGEIEAYIDLAECYAKLGNTEQAAAGLELIDSKIDELTCELPDIYAREAAKLHNLIDSVPESSKDSGNISAAENV